MKSLGNEKKSSGLALYMVAMGLSLAIRATILNLHVITVLPSFPLRVFTCFLLLIAPRRYQKCGINGKDHPF